jgi:putative ABC transport system permease protein
MFKNYLKITFRNLIKNKAFSVINISGLAIGIASFILISLYIRQELSYEDFNVKADRIYRPVEIQRPSGLPEQYVAVTMGPMAAALKNDFPEVETAARIMPVPTFFCEVGEKGFYEDEIACADPQIFNIFTIPFVEGNPAQALSEPNSIVLTQSIAKKYFGSEDPLGKMFTINQSTGKSEMKITGVIKDYPLNSHLHFTMLVSLSTLEDKMPWLKSWDTNCLATYVLLKKGIDKSQLEKKFPAFIEKYHKSDESYNWSLYLQPLKDIHLYSDHIIYQTYNHNAGSIAKVITFSTIALFILLIACINFMNLSTARSAKRIKEVGIRKVLGSSRSNLIIQFMGEAIIIALIAFVLAIIIVEFTFPLFKSVFNITLDFQFSDNVLFSLVMLLVTILVGIISGTYPSFYMSSVQPVKSLKDSRNNSGGALLIRKILVVSQFAIAIILIVSSGIVMEQMNFIRDKNLGFNKEHLLYIPIRGKAEKDNIELMKNELLQNNNIIAASAVSGPIGASGTQGTETVEGTGDQTKLMMRKSYVDFDYFKTMQLKMVEGRAFSREFPTDSNRAVIINQTAVKKFGWKNPIGKQFKDEPVRTVIGVVHDYNYYSVHAEIEPQIIRISNDYINDLLVRIKPGDIHQTTDYIESAWNRINPGKPFEYTFVDDYLNKIYKSDLNTQKLFETFAFIAIFIACLGLFGLASFTAEQKTKEIGVRKVLGSTVSGIVLLLSREFIKWVLFACVIAFPVSYILMKDWLTKFAYRTEISAFVFVIAALLTILIALFTVCYQSVKAALANPVKSLRYE